MRPIRVLRLPFFFADPVGGGSLRMARELETDGMPHLVEPLTGQVQLGASLLEILLERAGLLVTHAARPAISPSELAEPVPGNAIRLNANKKVVFQP